MNRGRVRSLRDIYLLFCLGCITACSTTLPEEEVVEVISPSESQPIVERKQPSAEEYPVTNFDEDDLYGLLLAEIGGFRGNYELALKNYVDIAKSSRDPGVAARATILSYYLRSYESALITSQIWAEEDPDNIDAHRYAADQFRIDGDLESAIFHMETIKQLGGLANFELVAFQAENLDQVGRNILLSTISEMLEADPEDEQLRFSQAVLLEQNGDYEKALEIANDLLEAKRDLNVILLKVNSLKGLQRNTEASIFFKTMLMEIPESRRLRLVYAQFLFEVGDLEGSNEQYKSLLEGSPSDGDILLPLALISLELKDNDGARRYLEDMVRWNRRVDEAHFYLGSIAENEGDLDQALVKYKQAGRGYQFLPAQSRIAVILLKQGLINEMREYLELKRREYPNFYEQLVFLEAQILSDSNYEEEVFQLLDGAVSANPNSLDLLYFRATKGQKFGRLDILERDLRSIITKDPVNADALNALGYTLADLTDRHEEALALIQRALKIKPKEPAYIDSLGWVLYRLKRFEEALMYLRQALSLFPNDEVAAHLGEVLWVTGERREASRVWEEALELAPESEILKRVIKQFILP